MAASEAFSCRLAAIVFDRDEDPDAPLAAFLAAQVARGLKVAGWLQQREPVESCACADYSLLNLTTGERLTVMQDLGRDATGCRLDPRAIAIAAVEFQIALGRQPDLLIANRFGKLEVEGGGMLAEIGDAIAEGAALIICVPARFLAEWNAFAAGLDIQLPPQLEAIEGWWASVAPRRASAA